MTLYDSVETFRGPSSLWEGTKERLALPKRRHLGAFEEFSKREQHRPGKQYGAPATVVAILPPILPPPVWTPAACWREHTAARFEGSERGEHQVASWLGHQRSSWSDGRGGGEARGRKTRKKSEKEGSCRSRGSQRKVTELSDLRSDNGGESKSIFELGEVDRMQRSISLHSRVGREGSQKVIFTNIIHHTPNLENWTCSIISNLQTYRLDNVHPKNLRCE